MRYLEQLDTTSAAVVALAERTASLAEFRASERRRLSLDTRTTCAAMAVRLRATADRLDSLAAAPPTRDEEIARLVAQARALGVPV